MVFHVYRKNDRKWEILFGENYNELLNTLSLRITDQSKGEIEKQYDIIPLSTYQDFEFSQI